MKYCCEKFEEEFEYTIFKEHEYHEYYDELFYYIHVPVCRIIITHCPFCGTKLESGK